jgi:anti-anti-sigma factor
LNVGGYVDLGEICQYNDCKNKIMEKVMKDEALVITESISGGVCRIIAKGRVDANSADSLLFTLENVLKKGQKTIVLNMLQVEYLSSIGIRVILKIFKQAAEAGGTFKIEEPSEIVKNVLGMVALNEMLLIE